jgi:hypothetical protein
MRDIQLRPNGNVVRVGAIQLRSPGLAGFATKVETPAGDLRGGALDRPVLEDSLARNEIHRQDTIVLEGLREIPDIPASRTRHDEPAIEIEAPEPPREYGQFVLLTDEAGIVTVNFAASFGRRVPGEPSRGPGAMRTYLIRRTIAPTQAATDNEFRGLAGVLGKKVLDILVFPLIDPFLGQVGDYFAGAWESRRRQYRVRTITQENYRTAQVQGFQPQDWKHISEGKSLLLIHGTFSQAHETFHDLTPDFIADLHRLYSGRVFAFDHLTLREDPMKNAEWFLEQVPKDTSLHIDILSHSRGGLVARTLAEKQSELSPTGSALSVDRVIQVAAPNAGTSLTDGVYLNDLIDCYTNILNFLPDSPSSIVLDALFAVAKQLAVDTLIGLDGLQAMLPGGKFLRKLNTGTATVRYFALASACKPNAPGLLAWAADRLFQRIFQGLENDLVVPTGGVYEGNGSALFPIASTRCLVFRPEDDVNHVGYFAQERARRTIYKWLAEA